MCPALFSRKCKEIQALSQGIDSLFGEMCKYIRVFEIEHTIMCCNV